MSYARFGADDSDVYVFPTEREDRATGAKQRLIECCGCTLGDDCHFARTTEDAVAHLREHQEKGDCVPEYAIATIEAGRFCETGNPL
jgi:hypothetical protein